MKAMWICDECKHPHISGAWGVVEQCPACDCAKYDPVVEAARRASEFYKSICDNCAHPATSHNNGHGECLSATEGQSGMHEGFCGCDKFENAAIARSGALRTDTDRWAHLASQSYVESNAGRRPIELIVDTAPHGWRSVRRGEVVFEACNEEADSRVTLKRDEIVRLHTQLGDWLASDLSRNGEAL